MANKKNIIGKGFESNPQNINKSGRPVGARSRTTIVKYWLEAIKDAKNPITGQIEALSIADQITIAQIKKALESDTAAYKELMDRAYGKSKQQMDITTDGEKITGFDVIIMNETEN